MPHNRCRFGCASNFLTSLVSLNERPRPMGSDLSVTYLQHSKEIAARCSRGDVPRLLVHAQNGLRAERAAWHCRRPVHPQTFVVRDASVGSGRHSTRRSLGVANRTRRGSRGRQRSTVTAIRPGALLGEPRSGFVPGLAANREHSWQCRQSRTRPVPVAGCAAHRGNQGARVTSRPPPIESRGALETARRVAAVPS
jgi:hypothetical protein